MSLNIWLHFSSQAIVAITFLGPPVLLVIFHDLQYDPYRSNCNLPGNVSGLFIIWLFSVLRAITELLCSTLALTGINPLWVVYVISSGIKLWWYCLIGRLKHFLFWLFSTTATKNSRSFIYQDLTARIFGGVSLCFDTAFGTTPLGRGIFQNNP
jgi:hypothetical protein